MTRVKYYYEKRERGDIIRHHNIVKIFGHNNHRFKGGFMFNHLPIKILHKDIGFFLIDVTRPLIISFFFLLIYICKKLQRFLGYPKN